MTREEHMNWAKKRALAYIDAGDTKNAFASMVSDLGKHEATAGHMAIDMGMMMLLGGMLNSTEQMRNFITGFN